MIKDILNYRVGIGQLIAIGLVIGIPYVVIGLIWAFTHNAHLDELEGIDKVFSFIGEVIAWPPLVISDITLK